MLAFDVLRADWRDALLDRAFRRGLVLLPAGERTVRFYPRYDTEPSAIDEALSILRLAIEDLVGRRVAASAKPPRTASKIRVGTLAIPLDTIEIVDSRRPTFETYKLQILAVEQERYGAQRSSRAGRRPSRPTTAAAVSARDARSDDGATRAPSASPCAIASRDASSATRSAARSRITTRRASASDPHFGENNTFYLQAMATSPTVQNSVDLENYLLDSLRERAIAAGFEFLSTLIEDRLRRDRSGLVPRGDRPRADRQLSAQRHPVRLSSGGAETSGPWRLRREPHPVER